MPGSTGPFCSCDKQLKKGFRPYLRAYVRNAFSNMLVQVEGQLGYVLMGQEGSVDINLGQLGSVSAE